MIIQNDHDIIMLYHDEYKYDTHIYIYIYTYDYICNTYVSSYTEMICERLWKP